LHPGRRVRIRSDVSGLPFGTLYDLPTWVDRSLTTDEYIVFEAGSHTDAIKMRYADFEKLAGPRVAEFAEKLH
jgi:Ala-tRNA(Pro) deacylase